MGVSLAKTYESSLLSQRSSFKTSDPTELIEIFKPEINFVQLRRKRNQEIEKIIQNINLASPLLRVIDPQDFKIDSFSNELKGVTNPEALVRDIKWLAEIFEMISGAKKIGLRLAELHSPMCPGFHYDKVSLRLICTYTGPATQWLDNAFVARQQRNPHNLNEAKRVILLAGESEIQELGNYDIGLLKGENWLDENGSNEGKGVVHRSPPKESHDYRRVILTLDTLE